MLNLKPSLGEFMFEVMDNKIDGYGVLFFVFCSCSRYDDISILQSRPYEFNEGWFYELVVRFEYAFNSTAPVLDVPRHTSR